MSAIDTLDGLDVGTDLGIERGSQVEHWELAEDRTVVRNGQRLDVWFLSGLLAEGKVHLGNQSPAQPGEWFLGGGTRRYLVLEVEGEGREQKAVSAIYRNNAFYSYVETVNLAEQLERCPAPDWGGEQLQVMALRTYVAERRLREFEQQSSNAYRVKQYLDSIKNYVDAAVELAAR